MAWYDDAVDDWSKIPGNKESFDFLDWTGATGGATGDWLESAVTGKEKEDAKAREALDKILAEYEGIEPPDLGTVDYHDFRVGKRCYRPCFKGAANGIDCSA